MWGFSIPQDASDADDQEAKEIERGEPSGLSDGEESDDEGMNLPIFSFVLTQLDCIILYGCGVFNVF